MRYVYAILFSLCFFLNANATNYFVRNSGSDAANGTSTGTPWQTIAKVNTFTFSPGDSIFFNRGDVWVERLVPLSSGTITQKIYFGAYGSGAKPIITGFQTQGSFSNVGNIWTATASNAVKSLNTVTVGGSLQGMARTPNTGFSTFTTTPANNQIGGTALTGTPDYTGSLLVVKDAHWILDVVRVTSQSGATLTFNPATTYGTSAGSLGGNGYFLMNNVSDLDVQNEWQIDSATKTLKVYSTTSPTVQVSTIDTLVWISKKNYLVFDNLAFTGSNKSAFQIDTANRVTIQNCVLNNNGRYGIAAQKCQRLQILKDSITNTLSVAILPKNKNTDLVGGPTINTCDSTKIDSCYIYNTGTIWGMGGSGNGEYQSVYINGTFDTITNNIVKNSGYAGIYWYGRSNFIAYNLVDTFCYVKDDGGGIYTYAASAYFPPNYDSASEERKNIVLHGLGYALGTSDGIKEAGGIYLDDNTKFVTIDSNTSSYHSFASLETYGENANLNIFDNTFEDSVGDAGQLDENISPSTNTTIKRNIFYQRNTANKAFAVWQANTGMTIDSNYYLKLVDPSAMMRYIGSSYNFANWQSTTGYDAHSTGTLAGLSSNVGTLTYNASHSNLVVPLVGNYKDAKGNIYIGGTVTIPEFQSIILFPMASLTFMYNNKYKVK